MAGTSPFSFGAHPKVNEPKTSTAPQGFSAFRPATSITTAVSPAQPIPDPFTSSTFGVPDDQAIEGSLSSTPRNAFGFGPPFGSTVKQEGSSSSRPPLLFGSLSSASPVAQYPLGFGQIPTSSTTQSRFSFGSMNSASPAPQSPFNLSFGTQGVEIANFGASSTTQAADITTESTSGASAAKELPTVPSTKVAPASCAGILGSTLSSVTAKVTLKPGRFDDINFPSSPATSVDAGASKGQRGDEAAGAPEDLRSAQLQLWHNKHMDLIVPCGEDSWQCHKALLLPRCPAFETACVVRASDGKHKLKLDRQKPEVVESLLIYLYTYELPKFTTAGDTSIGLYLGNLYPITKFAESARSQILEGVKKFGKMGNEDIRSWVQNFELWWVPQQTAMKDIQSDALKLIVNQYEQFAWSDDFMNLLGRIKYFRIEVFRAMAMHKGESSITMPHASPQTETYQIDGLPAITKAQARLLVQKHEVIRRIVTANIKRCVARKEAALRREFALAQAATTS